MADSHVITSAYLDISLCAQVNDELVEIQEFPNQVKGILWENSHDDKGIFIAYDNDIIYSYIYSKHTMKGDCLSEMINIELNIMPKNSKLLPIPSVECTSREKRQF